MKQMYQIKPRYRPDIMQISNNPPTLYSILNSLVNYNTEEQTKILDLADKSRKYVFDFDYPLSTTITKERFETNILNKFLMRRINFETFTAFKISLNVKLNEIMPRYNILFDGINKLKLFDGEEIERTLSENKTSESKTQNSSDNNASNKGRTSNEDIEDLRNSELPQNRLEDLRNGEYVTNYHYNISRLNSSDSSENTSSSKSNSSNNMEDNSELTEKIKHTNANKIELYNQFLIESTNIFTQIYKDLDILFYQIIDL